MIPQVAFAFRKLAFQFFHPNISQSQMLSKTKEEKNTEVKKHIVFPIWQIWREEWKEKPFMLQN